MNAVYSRYSPPDVVRMPSGFGVMIRLGFGISGPCKPIQKGGVVITLSGGK